MLWQYKNKCNCTELNRTPNKQYILIFWYLCFSSVKSFFFSVPLGPQLIAPPAGSSWGWQLWQPGLVTSLTTYAINTFITWNKAFDARFFFAAEYHLLCAAVFPRTIMLFSALRNISWSLEALKGIKREALVTFRYILITAWHLDTYAGLLYVWLL